MQMNARTLALDLDGILLDGMPFHIRAWMLAFEQYGFEPDSRELYRLEGIKTQDVIQILRRRHALDLSQNDCEAIAAQKKKTYQDLFRPVPLPGARKLLATLSEFNYEAAIVTGTARSSAVATLDSLGASEYISTIISSDDNLPGKPDGAPFREAARQLATQLEFCLAVDNAPPGIASATDAGLPCVGVATYLPPEDLSAADLVIESVEALALWIGDEHDDSGGVGPWLRSLE